MNAEEKATFKKVRSLIPAELEEYDRDVSLFMYVIFLLFLCML